MRIVEIPGYPDYLITEEGEIYRTTYRNGNAYSKYDKPRKLSQNEQGSGYLHAILCRDNTETTLLVHRLVLLSFVGECPAGLQVSHLDGNKRNCRLDNLVYESAKKNTARKSIHGTLLYGEKHPRHKLTEHDVVEILESSDTSTLLASKYNVTKQAICLIRKGKTWTRLSRALARA